MVFKKGDIQLCNNMNEVNYNGMIKHCCDDMAYHANYKCEIHENPFECPDKLIIFHERNKEYGLIIHDGGSSSIEILYCPWCGKKLKK
jgi:hypothetical protein